MEAIYELSCYFYDVNLSIHDCLHLFKPHKFELNKTHRFPQVPRTKIKHLPASQPTDHQKRPERVRVLLAVPRCARRLRLLPRRPPSRALVYPLVYHPDYPRRLVSVPFRDASGPCRHAPGPCRVLRGRMRLCPAIEQIQ